MKIVQSIRLRVVDHQHQIQLEASHQGTPQVSIQEPVLFNIFINNLQGETEWTFSKFTDNAKLREAVDTQRVLLPFRGTLTS